VREGSVKRFITAIALVMALYLVAATPVAAASATSRYATFLGHTLGALATGLDLLDEVQTDVDLELYYSAIDDLNRLYARAKMEVVWLNRHPAATCYKKTWATVRNFWTQLREGASAGSKALNNYDWDALSDMETHMTAAIKYANSASALMKKTTCGVTP
jgi:hypothetical protein